MSNKAGGMTFSKIVDESVNGSVRRIASIHTIDISFWAARRDASLGASRA
jgi:hypothetical protein